MGSFISRRLIWAVFTIFGVMLLTFALFRLAPGDVSARFVNPKLGKEARIAWLRKNNLHLPLIANLRRRLVIADTTAGESEFAVRDGTGSKVVNAMLLERPSEQPHRSRAPTIVSQPVYLLSGQTPLAKLTDGDAWTARPGPGTQPAEPPRPIIIFSLRDGSELRIDLSGLSDRPNGPARPAATATAGDLIRLINEHPANRGRAEARISRLSVRQFFRSQFFWHLRDSLTFRSRSFKTNELLLSIITKRAKYSLAITVPVMALGWLSAMIVSSIVAYYRASLIDKLGVFVCVLGMCIPYLVYMIAGQALIFEVAPKAAWGLHNPANIYVPVGIALFAGLGGSVRFYRTVILDQVNQDYVRTARAKGVPLHGILFRHVLKNCMLPILTSLVVSIPFLVMGSLLLEQFFGVPGLGSLMLTSVSDRDVPIISGLTFLTAVVYVLGLLITDVLYAVFDPRVRLR